MSQVAVVVCFQSLILDMAGNVGTQSLAVTIRVLMDEEISGKDKVQFVLKEMRVGCAKGVYRKGTGTPRKQQAAQGRGKGHATVILTVAYHRQPNMERGLILCRQ